jgi:hypothetical protein
MGEEKKEKPPSIEIDIHDEMKLLEEKKRKAKEKNKDK